MRNKSLLTVMLALLAPLAMWGQLTLPYQYGFENATGTSASATAAALSAEGWTYQYCSIYASSNNPFFHDGSKSLRIDSSDGANGYLISPELPETENGVSLEFYYGLRTNKPTEFRVGYSMTTNDLDDFIWGDLIYLDVVNEWQHYVKDFPANVKYIAISKSFVLGMLYVDDFNFSEATCAIPTIPVIGETTSQSVSLSWNGNSESYSLKYAPYYKADFVEGLCGWVPSFGNPSWEWSPIPDYGYCFYEPGAVISEVSSSQPNNYIVSPAIPAGSQVSFYAYGHTILPDGFKVEDLDRNRNNFDFTVMVATVENPTLNDFVQVESFTASDEYWKRYTIDLSSYIGTCHVAICHVNSGKDRQDEIHYILVIDDITISYPWEELDGIQATNYTLENYGNESLNSETFYAIKVKGDCDQWTDALDVLTLPTTMPDTYEFIKDGNWNVAQNWKHWIMPTADGDVIISAKARIPAGYVAQAGDITLASYGSLTIAEGGQLKHNNTGVVATMEKYITGYTNGNGTDHYYLLAFPTYSVFHIEGGNNFINNLIFDIYNSTQPVVYDLYTFDQNESERSEWVNFECYVPDPDKPGDSIRIYQFNTIQNGKGYLYAREVSTTLKFVTNGGGIHSSNSLMPSNQDVNVPLAYTAGKSFAGWNLIGNPFACNAYLTENRQFYRLEEMEEGSRLVLATDMAIAPMEGVFVLAESNGEHATFTSTEPSKNSDNLMDFTLRKANRRTKANIDRTRVVFGEGSNMSHLDLMADPNRLYFPIDNKAMSVVYAQPVGELPLNLEVATEGTFVLNFECRAEGLVYCHLIDNLTGADIDLLQTPEYSFDSRLTDYASRFRVLFAKAEETNNITNEDFAYIFNDNLIISNEGHATLQVIDLQGRIIKSETIEGNAYTAVNVVPGVYLLRLVNGNSVKVQKVVVR